MIIYKSRFLTRGEVWFDDMPDRRTVDWIQYHHRSSPVPGAKSNYFHTLLIDLAPKPEQLLAEMNTDNAYKIRRSRDKDKVTCHCCDASDAAVLDAFEAMHNRFASVKALSPIDRPRLDSMAAEGVLEISMAKDATGTPIVYHANYRNSERSCLQFSASQHREVSDSTARNAIGRANRYLTWCDMLRSKEGGLKQFDFGGWYPGSTNQELLRINQFKKGFGGRVVREYECEQILTVRGWVVLTVAALLQRRKTALARSDFTRPECATS